MVTSLSTRTQLLTQSTLFKSTYVNNLPLKERTRLVYDRAKAIAKAYSTFDDSVHALERRTYNTFLYLSRADSP